MGSLVAGHLENYKRKAKFEDDLRRDEAAESIVITLFGWRKKPGDQGDCYHSCETGPSSAQNGERDRSVHTQPFS